MTDLQIQRMCCEAMGFQHYTSKIGILFAKNYFPKDVQPRDYPYNPLINGEQTLALVKKFGLHVEPVRFLPNIPDQGNLWRATYWDRHSDPVDIECFGYNRAVCRCIAKVESNKRFGQPHHGH